MYPPMRAHSHHLATTIELVQPLAYLSPQPKRQIDRFSRFCTDHGRKSLYFTIGYPIHHNCPLPWGIWTPIQHMIPWTHANQTPKGHVDRFSRFCTADCRVSLYCAMVRPFLPDPLPQIDIIGAMAIVWRVRGKLSGLFCAILSATIVHSAMHRHMNRPNSSQDWGLSHWAHYTVLRLNSFLYILCITEYCMHA